MKLTVFNGSPRGRNSNSQVFIDKFSKGFQDEGGEISKTSLLIQTKNVAHFAAEFKEAEAALLVFPLYTDSMPGIVKYFIEEVGDYDGKQKPAVFMVHSGFSGGIHCVTVVKYLEMLSKRWNLSLAGIIVKPGSEGTRLKPDSWNRRMIKSMHRFGSDFLKYGKLDPRQLKRFKGPDQLSGYQLTGYKLMNWIGLSNMYWNMNLKKHGAYAKRFDAPYQ